GMGGSGKNPSQRLASAAAGRLCQGDAASDRPKGDRPRGVDDGVVSRHAREGGASSTLRPFASSTNVSGILDHPPSRVMTMEGLNLPSTRKAIACSIATLFRTSHGCEVRITM